jgi:bla regulator protein blaR1
MTFLAFGAAITLAAFLLANGLFSLAVAIVAPTVIHRLPSDRLQARARVLLSLRLLPAAAAAVAAGLVLPAYLMLEPADTGERVTVSLALLAAAAVAILLHGLVRGARALWATARLVGGWQQESEPATRSSSAVPVYRVRDPFPVFAVVGWRRPRMYVSGRVLDALTPAELAAAVAHEDAHLRAADNLKRLLIRSAPDLLVLSGASLAIEEEWGRAAEAIADERASGGDRDVALALAASLVKVARLAPAPTAGLPVSALHDGGDLEARVRRLVAGDDLPRHGATGGAKGALIAAAVATAGIAGAVYALPAVHALIEVAARLLR